MEVAAAAAAKFQESSCHFRIPGRPASTTINHKRGRWFSPRPPHTNLISCFSWPPSLIFCQIHSRLWMTGVCHFHTNRMNRGTLCVSEMWTSVTDFIHKYVYYSELQTPLWGARWLAYQACSHRLPRKKDCHPPRKWAWWGCHFLQMSTKWTTSHCKSKVL